MKQTEKVSTLIYQYVTINGKNYVGFGGTDNARIMIKEPIL